MRQIDERCVKLVKKKPCKASTPNTEDTRLREWGGLISEDGPVVRGSPFVSIIISRVNVERKRRARCRQRIDARHPIAKSVRVHVKASVAQATAARLRTFLVKNEEKGSTGTAFPHSIDFFESQEVAFFVILVFVILRRVIFCECMLSVLVTNSEWSL